MLKKIALLIVAMLCSGIAHGKTITAASCNNNAGQLDIQNAVNQAVNGDTVNIPNGNCTWSVTVDLTVAITFQGTSAPGLCSFPNGQTQCGIQITDTNPTSCTNHGAPCQPDASNLFIIESVANQRTIIGNLSFHPGTAPGNYILLRGSGGLPTLMHDVSMENNSTMVNQFQWMQQGGVIWDFDLYNNTPLASCAGGAAGNGSIFINSTYPWDNPDTMGTADTNGNINVYIEDSRLFNVDQAPDIGDNGRVVLRHMTIIGSAGLTHGITGPTGGRHVEYYQDSFQYPNGNRNMNRWFWLRSGTMVMTQNSIDFINSSTASQVPNGCYPNKPSFEAVVEGAKSNANSHGCCTFTATGNSCWHQAGTGAAASPPAPFNPSNLYTSQFAAGGVGGDTSQFIDPVYIWNNTGAGQGSSHYDTNESGLALNCSTTNPNTGQPYKSSDFYVNGTENHYDDTSNPNNGAKPGWVPYPYPQPLRALVQQPQQIAVSSNGKFLVSQITGKPVFLTGDAPQLLTLQLCLNSDITQYLTDRQSRGFNALWVIAVDQTDQNNAPHDGCGNLPFTSGGLSPNNWFGTMNSTYWGRIDSVVAQASSLGMAIFLQPSFIGNHDAQPSYDTPQWNVAANQTTIVNYCTTFATRYAAANNIVYLLGGDYDPSNAVIKANVEACGAAMKAADPNHLITIEGFGANPGSNLSTAPYGTTPPSWLSMNFAYSHLSFSNTVSVAQSGFNNNPLLPPFQGEDDYENEGATSFQSRQQGYLEVLSGLYVGRLFGNHSIWSFNATHAGAPNQTWQSQLASVGSTSQQFLGALMNSREHWLMVPDISHTYLTGGIGSGNNVSVASRSSDGQTIIVYDPLGTGQNPTVNLSGIISSSSSVKEWWYNPSTGMAIFIGTHANSGSVAFTAPDTNDWVLVLDDASANLSPPGGSGIPSTSYSPSPLAFGPVTVGAATAMQTLVITNTGTAPVTITSLVIGDTVNYSVGTPCTTINVSSFCNQVINFAPTTTGNKPTTLTVNSNSSTNPDVINITGSGILVPTVTSGIKIQGVQIQ